MPYIRHIDHIVCESCGKHIHEGDTAYQYHLMNLCESCMDDRLESIKEEHAVEVNDSNFDLEEEE